MVAVVGILVWIGNLFGGSAGENAEPNRYPLPGDNSEGGIDITLPDGSEVRPDEVLTKIWEIHNTGTVFWKDRYMSRMEEDAGGCLSEARVRIPDTAPGQSVQASVKITTSSSPGECYARWKMTDADGSPVFPTKEGIWYKIEVLTQ
ncbi:hypothetical protein CC117_30985 [Parafrankia colletiae]|uniref:Nbr1 FW domain-containing protein n=2 Tax=Parafrankia colletiae TaxID=573497 RepID=A0A1S1Q2C1_9ACTN|nr:hypothetical protein CC117_30985 [Parafrankia colletiae]